MYSYTQLDKLLKENNITAYKVGKETNVSTATLTSWKKGKYMPKIDKISRIAKYLNVPLEKLEEKEN